MLNARIGKELVVRVPNESGCLATLSKLISDGGVNMSAVCAWVEGDDALIRIVTEDNLRVADVLRSKVIEFRETEVVLVDLANKPGMLRHVTARFAEREIELHHLYVTALPDNNRCLIVCSTAHNERAVVVLND